MFSILIDDSIDNITVCLISFCTVLFLLVETIVRELRQINVCPLYFQTPEECKSCKRS